MTNQARAGNTLNVALNGILIGTLQKNSNGAISSIYQLPVDFPQYISESIFSGIEEQSKKLIFA